MSTITIRVATEQDVDVLGEVYYEFHEFHVRGIPTHLHTLGKKDAWDRSRFHEALEKIFESNDSRIFLAEVSGQPAGLIEVHIRQDEADPSLVCHTYMHLQSLMVLEPFRRGGLGSQLVDTAKAWARERGATEIRLSVWEFNETARGFYDSLGFRTLKRTMIVEL